MAKISFKKVEKGVRTARGIAYLISLIVDKVKGRKMGRTYKRVQGALKDTEFFAIWEDNLSANFQKQIIPFMRDLNGNHTPGDFKELGVVCDKAARKILQAMKKDKGKE